MTWFLVLLMPAFAQDVDGSIDCEGSWYTADFTTLGADDDCPAYADTGVCAQPSATTSPDQIFHFSSPDNVWVQMELSWGLRLRMNYYTLVDDLCGTAITCASGYWNGFAGVTWFSAEANRDYYLAFDNQGEDNGPPGQLFAEIQGFTCCYDDDGDGFYNPDDGCDRMPANAQDCDDADPFNFPGNAEVCDGTDNDCDGNIDENASATYYFDGDGDGYGDDGATVVDCGAPTGYVEQGGDCDDANPQVNPGVAELCNGSDDDCDGQTDEGFDSDGNGVPDCADNEVCDGRDNDGDGLIDDDDPDLDLASAPIWYLDVDGDGHADPANTVKQCTRPTNGYASADDCDDANATRYPGLAETCDGIDNNCNVTVDEGTACYDDDGDGFSELGGDCNDAQAALHPGVVETCNGVDEDCDGRVDEGTECTDDDQDGYCEGTTCADGSTPGDCNDGLAAVNPGVTEIEGNGIDDDCNGAVDSQASDPDGDGITSDAGDCAPLDGTIHPGAPETADGVDNDCDGSIDEGTPAGDDDGDGFCEGANLDNSGGLDCGDGTIAGDCNDADRDTNANGTDVPNERDDDCDGLIDEGTPGTDDDQDGFSEEAGDCDDAVREIFPGAEEVEDAVDNDCDGTVDEGFVDVDGDGVTAEDGDCDDSNGWVSPERAEICLDAVDNDCDGVIDEGCGAVTPPPPRTCGCDQGGGFAGWWLLPVAALLRRRRA